MTLHTERLYTSRTRIAGRVLLTILIYASALLVYPMLTTLLGLVCLIWYGGYEVMGAALILDALLAQGGGVIGEYHFTVLFLIAGAATSTLRRALRTSQQ
jgi:hypothetical protein